MKARANEAAPYGRSMVATLGTGRDVHAVGARQPHDNGAVRITAKQPGSPTPGLVAVVGGDIDPTCEWRDAPNGWQRGAQWRVVSDSRVLYAHTTGQWGILDTTGLPHGGWRSNVKRGLVGAGDMRGSPARLRQAQEAVDTAWREMQSPAEARRVDVMRDPVPAAPTTLVESIALMERGWWLALSDSPKAAKRRIVAGESQYYQHDRGWYAKGLDEPGFTVSVTHGSYRPVRPEHP
jgi:hypothetical protein